MEPQNVPCIKGGWAEGALGRQCGQGPPLTPPPLAGSRGQMEDKLPGQNGRPRVTLSPSFQSRSMEGLVALPEDRQTVGETVFTVDFFQPLSAILGNVCLELLGVHCVCLFLLFCCGLYWVPWLYRNPSHPTIGKFE